jgi:hypothetical protein
MAPARLLHLRRPGILATPTAGPVARGAITANRISVKTLIKWLLATFMACAASFVHAQLLDDVSVRRDGANAVIQVRFVTPVRLQRTVATGSDDLGHVLYDVLDPIGARNAFNTSTGQRRALSGGAGLPRVTVTDETIGGGNAATRRLVLKFDRPTRFTVRTGRGDRTIEVVLEGLGGDVKPPTPLSSPQAPDGAKRYLITLISSRDPNVQMDLPVPGALQDYQVFTDRRLSGGQTLYEINLGYFTTLPEAEQARTLLLRRFPNAAVVALADRTPAPAARAPAGAGPGAGTVIAPVAPAEVQTQATQLMATAKSALDGKDIDGAITALNTLLDLPGNPLSREAQELVGFVRLRAGDNDRARKEFELFLKLYPNGPDADRVRQKLASLPAADLPPERRRAAATPPSTTISGSVSTRYSEFRFQDEEEAAASGDFLVASKRLDTNADLNLRYRDADRDVRFVFRNNYSADLIDGDRSFNRLTAAYAEYKSFSLGTSVRLGRQPPSGGGAFKVFDGIQAGYSFLPKWRVNVVGGIPVDQILESKTYFYGLSVDADALTPNLSGSLYAITDITDNFVDRRAFGTELRYFNGGLSASTLLDVDQVIGALNIATLQASWQLQSGTSFNFLFDYRAQPSPIAALSNILFLPFADLNPRDTLKEVIDEFGEDAVRDSVRDTTGTSTQFLLGATTPFSKNWQLGADVRLTNISAIDALDNDVVDFQEQTGTGNIYTVSTQLIGTNLYSRRDTHVFSLSVIASELFAGLALSYNNSSALGDSWLIEPSLRFFYQSNQDSSKSATVSPGLRVTYQLTQRLSLDADVNYDFQKSNDQDGIESIDKNVFYILGGRFDF